MPRRVQDIIPSGKRSIRDITLEENTREKTRHTIEKTTEIKIHKPKRDEPVGHVISFKPETTTKKRKSDNPLKMLLVFLGTTIVILIVGYFASQYYAKANFTIVPRSYTVNVNKTVVAQSKNVENAVLYDIKSVSETESLVVPSTDGAYQETKATGKVTIYNNYATTAQRLIAGTRLAQTNGLVYKLSNSVTVPGKTTKGPGQIVVSVIADKAGAEYNIKKSSDVTMKLLGFLGTPKYDSFYAKMSTDIAGGFAGKKKNISTETLASSTKYLNEKLKAVLTMKAKDTTTADEVLFEEGILFSTSSISISDNDDKSSKISMTGTVDIILFDKDSLFSKIAGEEIINKFKGYDYYVKGLDDMKVSFTNLKDFSPTKKNTLMANFGGEISIVAQIPIEEIKKKLTGLPLSKTYDVIKSYPELIDPTSKGGVFPSWSKVPSNDKNIEIKVVQP